MSNPRPVGFVSPISDTDVKDGYNKKDHNPIHNVAHYLKNSVTLESKEDEERREDAISDHAREEHGVKPKKEQFWEEHGKRPAVEGGVGFEGASGKETTNERVG